VQSFAILLALGLALNSPIALGQEAAKAPALAPESGEVQLKMPGGGIYIGTVTNGVPDGKGYFKDADGMQYEGEVRMGQRSGVAEGVFPGGDRYQGEWKDGKPHGIGKMVYMLGGSYEGEWKNGERDGKGVMVFAGSGRRAEVYFAKNHRVLQAPNQPAASAPARFSLSSRYPEVGSFIPYKIAYGDVPLDRGFAELTPEQQERVRSEYPTLEAGDDPPYPAKGGKELYSALSALSGRLGLKGDIWVYVTVNAEGKMTSVTTAGPFDTEIKRAIGSAAGLLGYTPAHCSGQPCPGVWGVKLKLTLD
jgi:hypothetical protein